MLGDELASGRLLYNRARYYAPDLARFVSADPLGLAAGMNEYSYVGNSPLMYTDPYGLFELPALPQGLVDSVTGFGDSASLGLTGVIRDLADIDGGVNKCSTAYQAGSWGAFALGGSRLAYAGLAKGYSAVASSGAAASAFRSRLRVAFGGGGSLRPPNLAKYPTDDALRAAAGRTNPYANAYGAGVAATGAYKGSGCGCSQ